MDEIKNPQIQLCLLQALSVYIEPENQRQRIKKSFFKVLQAIYQIMRTNENKGRSEHFPSKELIADVAGCGRRQVTDFVTSTCFSEFCDVQRSYNKEKKRFAPNRYVLKKGIYELFVLFWRSGMMKNFRKNYDWWLSDFKKRIQNWLIPLLENGKTVREIYESVVNKSSMRKCLKGAAGKCLKGAGIKSTRDIHKDSVIRETRYSEPPPLPSFQQMNFIGSQLSTRFLLKDGDINSIFNNFSLKDIKSGYNIHESRIKNGLKPKSQVAAFISAIMKGKENRQRLYEGIDRANRELR